MSKNVHGLFCANILDIIVFSYVNLYPFYFRPSEEQQAERRKVETPRGPAVMWNSTRRPRGAKRIANRSQEMPMWGHREGRGGGGKLNLIFVNYILNICMSKIQSNFLCGNFTSKYVYGLFMQIFWI